MKGMSTEFMMGSSYQGYGATLSIGLGIPIPVLNKEIAAYTAVRDEDIYTQIVDYSKDYPAGESRTYGEVNYKQLRSGHISINVKKSRRHPCQVIQRRQDS
jgi:uncharacterized protein (DUF39 family)